MKNGSPAQHLPSILPGRREEEVPRLLSSLFFGHSQGTHPIHREREQSIQFPVSESLLDSKAGQGCEFCTDKTHPNYLLIIINNVL